VGTMVLAQGPMLKAAAMIVLGLLISTIGIDPSSGMQRYTFGFPLLMDGVGFVALGLGLFGLTEIINNLSRGMQRSESSAIVSLMPEREDVRRATPAVLRGTAIGSILGVLPGGGVLLASFASYMVEKRIAKDPSRFGRGAVEGVAAPEAANNAAAQVSFIPMLTLGIPSNAVMALMIGALSIQGISPGPQVMVQQPQLFWGIIASMWIGNLMLVIINLPMVGIWVRLLRVPYALLYPSIMIFVSIGVLSVNNAPFEIFLTALFGAVGWALTKCGCELAPLVLAFVLGPLLESNLRLSLKLAHGDPLTFLQRPICVTLLMVAAAMLLLVVIPSIRRTRDVAFQEA